MKDYLQELSSTSTEIDSLFPNNESQLIQPASASLPPSQLGVFEVGAEGEVEIDFLFDGGAYLGEVGIFSLEGLSIDSQDFATEAANRALKNSQESGYIAISDLTDSAMISGSTPYDKNHNIGKYKTEHSFLMTAGTQFGIVFAANGSIQDAITNPNSGQLIFSLPQANTNQSIQFAQVPGVDSTGLAFTNSDTFAFEDIAGIASDNDFNDAIIQIKGATGSATQLDEVINPKRDWRDFESGRQVLELVGRQKEDEAPIVVNPPVITEPPDKKPPISIEPPPSEGGGGNDPGDGETGGSNPGGNEEEPVPLPPIIIEDKAGDTLLEARPTAISSSGKLYQDSVSINDNDYYNFVLGAKTKLDISADGIGQDIDLELLDNEGNVIASSKNKGNEKEIIEREVEGGRYNILITSPSSEVVAYDLDITATSYDGVKIMGSEKFVYPLTQQSLPLTGADEFARRSDKFKDNPLYPDIDGEGYSVVVIDSGINADHPAFGDRIIHSESFISGNKNKDPDDKSGHGTNIASIIASEDEKHPGVAPKVNIISLKIYDEGGGKLKDTEEALRWVKENAEKHNIVAVNLSYGINLNTNKPFYNLNDSDGLSHHIEELIEKDIIVVAAAGNSYKKYEEQGVQYPAADINTIAVGAVYDADVGWEVIPDLSDLFKHTAIDYKTKADKLTAFSQRSGDLPMVFAPGSKITGAGLNNQPFTYYSTERGTSQAAPHVTGMAVLAQQLAERELGRRLTPKEFRELLISTSDDITDEETDDDNVKNTGLTYKRVNMTNLAEAISNKELVEVEIIETSNELNTSEEIYSKITIDDNTRKTTPVENKSSITPSDWLAIKGAENEEVPIKIELFVNNESQEQIDINPNAGVKELKLLYNTRTGNIWDEYNDKNHFKDEELRRTGDEENSATVRFKIGDLTTESISNESKVIANISRVKGDLDSAFNDITLFGSSDFYPLISINNSEEIKLETIKNENEITPDWNVIEKVDDEAEEIPIIIKIFDDDKGEWLTDGDSEELNINPNSNMSNLNIIYNRNTGEIKDKITGQVYGKGGEEIKLIGSDNGNQGEVWFTIT
ncbi:putative peptidase (plasmid) [Calothrix parasitica NIES-267]|uniref:Putative peptidase n=1 Tax=Calothrix parasitica NIES-267 TaxID=1973488 RepID=A0A1Z4M2T8_9CYAN|nr:putative peptidase [Calothrix parasitica NIES-267]